MLYVLGDGSRREMVERLSGGPASVEGEFHFTLTEYGSHLDGFDNGTQRDEGTKSILDDLGQWLTRS